MRACPGFRHAHAYVLLRCLIAMFRFAGTLTGCEENFLISLSLYFRGAVATLAAFAIVHDAAAQGAATPV